MEALKKRRERAYARLRDAGFQKAVVGDPMTIDYLTGIHVIPYERYYGLVLDAERETAVMVNPTVDTGCMKGTVPEKIYLDSDGPMEAIRESVGDCKKLAVEKNYFSMATGELFQSLGCEVQDIGDCITRLRMCKDEAEVKYLQFAAEIVERAIAYVSE